MSTIDTHARAAVLAATLVAVSCSGHPETGRAAPDTGVVAAPTEGDGTIALDPKMRASIRVDTIAERDTASALAIAGKVQFDEDRVAHVLAPLAGRVVDLRVKVGDTTRKGQMLCAIGSREAAAVVGEHIEGRKDLELAEKNAAMTQDLFEHEAASRMALQQAQNDLAKARARVARTEEALRMLGLAGHDDLPPVDAVRGRVPIVSPIAGVVIERKVTEGQFVQSDSTPILTVGNLDTVWVVGDVFERDLRLVTVGQTASITTAAYPGDRFHGRVNYISPAIDPATRTAKVRVSVDNPRGRLKPEMFAAIDLHVDAHERALTVPTAAIFMETGRSYVYVEVSPGRFARRPIEVVSGGGTERGVLSGLRAGDRVVVDGVLLLRQEEQQRSS
ncbi:MAG: hypothetical protein AUJ01_07050 [Acidobacteria bacterium 13_1_40CM_3_65_5]|nr:MAG: hypothetical protein AUJ01_07050 [Acidobacteria bacterium 13_1_40CM_3_65_5]